MSLATRCFACGTVFRVVQDQLKVSEGWVRCGRCSEVFNALETLFDLERDTPPEWSPGALGESAGLPSIETHSAHHAQALSAPVQTDRIDAHLLGTRRKEGDSTPATRVDERDRLDFPDAQFESESSVWSTPPFDAAGSGAPASTSTIDPEAAATGAAPEFVRHAQRRARWQHPGTRAALGAAAMVLLAVLSGQATIHFRDLVAARWPAAKPALLAWCEWSGCSIELPKRIDDIAVESTALTRASEADAFKFAVTLRNRGAIALAPPSIDLSLTDATGLLVARRVLSPRDFQAGAAVLNSGAELPLQLALSAGSARVTGYTVEVFYP